MLTANCGKIARTVIATDIQFYYTDSNNSDLLDPANPISYKTKDIDVYYLVNGVKVRQNNLNMQNPECFNIDYNEETRKYLLNVFMNDKYDENSITYTYIDFGSTMDTIKTLWTIKENYLNYKQVWYNSKLVVTGDTLPGRIIIRR